jgi:prepilin-type N-terminal cleavage/methylation domain-containing protein
MKQLKNNQSGFTIIEVMIVLVIAAVILLIVFLAVPALQRNQRNTQRKEDVSGSLSAVNEFFTNNKNEYPTGFSGNQFTGATGTVTSGAKLGYYTAVPVQSTQITTAPNPGTDTLTIVTGAKCGTTAGTTASQSRSVAAIYGVENGSGGYTPVCQEL